MLYAIAAICVSLVVLALIGKPIRVEVIYTVPVQAQPDTELPKDPAAPEGLPAAMEAMAYINQHFHNVGEEQQNGSGK